MGSEMCIRDRLIASAKDRNSKLDNMIDKGNAAIKKLKAQESSKPKPSSSKPEPSSSEPESSKEPELSIEPEPESSMEETTHPEEQTA